MGSFMGRASYRDVHDSRKLTIRKSWDGNILQRDLRGGIPGGGETPRGLGSLLCSRKQADPQRKRAGTKGSKLVSSPSSFRGWCLVAEGAFGGWYMSRKLRAGLEMLLPAHSRDLPSKSWREAGFIGHQQCEVAFSRVQPNASLGAATEFRTRNSIDRDLVGSINASKAQAMLP